MSTNSPASPFRPDIEGLRALAVLLVIASHANVPGLAGGYIGVDVFFVISGFLITRLLRAEWQGTGRIDIGAFYARRMRRLLPAFAVLMLVVMPAIWIVYSPIEQSQHIASGMAATLYVSNLRYALGVMDYMQPESRLDPFLHTWSLGVEEQFYLLWPLLLVAAGLLSRRLQREKVEYWMLGGLLLVSLLLSVQLTTTHHQLAFYLPVTRAWEFAAGALVAVAQARGTHQATHPQLSSAAALGGLLLIIGSAATFTEHTIFPGLAVLLPVAGTLLVIHAIPAAGATTPAMRLLSLPVMQWLGRVSYAWYLWHWPLLVIGREVLHATSLAGDLALSGAALLLAQASYVLVEHPARTHPRLQRPAATYAMAATILLTFTLSLNLFMRWANDSSFGPRFFSFVAAMNDRTPLSHYACDTWIHGSTLVECSGGQENSGKTMVLLGDSHAGQWYTAIEAIARHHGYRLIVMTKSACPIIARDYFYDRIGRVFTECRDWKEKAVRRVEELRPQLLVVANSEQYDFTPGQWREGLENILPRLAAASGHLAVIRDTPTPGFSAPQCLARREWRPALNPQDCTFDPGASLSPDTLAAYRELASRHANMSVVDMTPVICQEMPCRSHYGKLVKFRDGNHLSDTYVGMLAKPLARALAGTGAL